MRALFAITAAVTLGSVLGATSAILVLGDRVRSRAEVVANAAALPPAVVTVAVERRALRAGVTFRATAGTEGARALSLPAAARGVVTKVAVRPGSALTTGAAPVEVQGRPVLALPGAFPFYRDIQPGDAGPDVAQLQGGLRAAGVSLPGEDGTFGPRTQAALEALYRRAGYRAPAAEAPAVASTTPLAAAPAARGVVARMSELWILRRLPQRVTGVTVRVGAVVGDGTSIGSAAGPLRLTGSLPSGSGDDPVRRGARADVHDELTRSTRGARVVEVRVGDGDESRTVVIELTDPKAVVKTGQSYRVTLAGRATRGSVAAVPVTAVQQRADGTRFVTVVAAGAMLADVAVRTGIHDAGWVEVLDPPAELAEGTRVVVGADTGATAP